MRRRAPTSRRRRWKKIIKRRCRKFNSFKTNRQRMAMANNQYILLVDEDGGRTVRAGDNFQWTPYPKTIEMDGRTWEYFFCADGVPHYRQVGMAAKPA